MANPAEHVEFGESFLSNVKTIQADVLPAGASSAESMSNFLRDVQQASAQEQADAVAAVGDQSTLQLLLSYLSSPEADIVAPAGQEDLTQPMSHYYISSSHNTYLTGNQLYSNSSTDGYKSVLLARCRCVEIDVWDGKPRQDGDGHADDGEHKGLRERLGLKHKHEPVPPPPAEVDPNRPPAPWRSTASTTVIEPRVLHGHTFTREVSFRKVCESIRDSAFVNTNLPLIVSLEVHTSHEQQEIMVDIMRSLWHEFLLDATHKSDVTALPSPDKLRRKILIKVKYTPPEKKSKQLETGVAESDSDDEETDNHQVDRQKTATATKKKKKIIDALSELGIYTRSCHFSNFEQPEAKLPTHVFAVSENKIVRAIQVHRHKLFAHNRNFFMRAYPKGLRVVSSNFNPIPMWRQGVQLVALNWQTRDEACMINTAMFTGTGGWVLKPARYRLDPSHPEAEQVVDLAQTPTSSSILSLTQTLSLDGIPRQSLDLAITVLAGQHLPKLTRHSKPYVKVILHTNSLASERAGDDSSTDNSRSSSPAGTDVTAEALQPDHARRGSHRGSLSTKTTRSRSTSADRRAATPKTKIKARTPPARGADPDFHAAVLRFARVPVEDADLAFVRFKVLAAHDVSRDEPVAWACVRLARLRQGVRVVRLFGPDWALGDARLLVRVEWSLASVDRSAAASAASLTGRGAPAVA